MIINEILKAMVIGAGMTIGTILVKKVADKADNPVNKAKIKGIINNFKNKFKKTEA